MGKTTKPSLHPWYARLGPDVVQKPLRPSLYQKNLSEEENKCYDSLAPSKGACKGPFFFRRRGEIEHSLFLF